MDTKWKISKRQWLLMAYLPIHLLWFAYLETIDFSDYTVMHCALDDIIPFCEWFVIPYITWFVYMVATGIYFLRYDAKAFENFCLSLFIGFFISMIIVSTWHSGQELRPQNLEVTNFPTWVLNIIYTVDTNTCVFPSMHIVGAVATAVNLSASSTLRKKVWLQICNWVLCILIVLATVFIKQHSALDVFAGIALETVVLLVVFKGWPGKLLDKLTKTRINEDNEIVAL